MRLAATSPAPSRSPSGSGPTWPARAEAWTPSRRKPIPVPAARWFRDLPALPPPVQRVRHRRVTRNPHRAASPEVVIDRQALARPPGWLEGGVPQPDGERMSASPTPRAGGAAPDFDTLQPACRPGAPPGVGAQNGPPGRESGTGDNESDRNGGKGNDAGGHTNASAFILAARDAASLTPVSATHRPCRAITPHTLDA